MKRPPIDIIAEVGSVHDGSFGNAVKLIEAAAEAGATSVKFQTHIADAETLPNAPTPSYFRAEPRHEYFQRTSFTIDQWKQLSTECEMNRVEFLSSPFSLEAVSLLEEIGIKRIKIPSGEVTNVPLLEKVATIGLPVLLSSGMSSWHELDDAVKILSKHNTPLVVMQCTSKYPCPPEKVGLNLMLEMHSRYGTPMGYSDHTLGDAACIAAVALGATVIEKHFTFSRKMYGSDAQHSMEPSDFSRLTASINEVSAIIRSPIEKTLDDDLSEMRNIFQKSIVAACDLNAGTVLTINDLAFKKPGNGLSAREYKFVVGKTVINDIKKNTLIRLCDLRNE